MKLFYPLTLLLITLLFWSCKKTSSEISSEIKEKIRLADLGICAPFSERTTVTSGTYTKDSAWLQLPCSYYATVNAAKKYPLLIFLNGTGESSNEGNLSIMKKFGPPTLINDSLRFIFSDSSSDNNFIVISPQSQTGFRNAASTNAIIDYMVKNFRVNEARVYLTGLSSGAQSIYYYLTEKQEYANRIAAAAPMSSVTLDSAHKANLKYIANAGVYIRSFCGVSDFYYSNNKKYVEEINSYKTGLATLVGYPGKHCCWNSIYDYRLGTYNPNVYEWLLQHHK